MTNRPLDGVTVIDCSSLIAGPMTATYLADYGADVIKIEHPNGGDPIRTFGLGPDGLAWKQYGRNKKSVTLDLHDDRCQELFKELVEDADVLIESFRPGTLEEWGLGWETLSEINPGLVMSRVTGFGQFGPYSDRTAFGTMADAMSTFAHITGPADGPPTLSNVPMADAITALQSTYAVMMALYWRDANDGTGQYIDVNLVESMFSIMGTQVLEYDVEGIVRERQGNRFPATAPRNAYQTKDDEWVALSGSNERNARRTLEAIGGEELATDPRFRTMADRLENVEELDRIIAEWMAERPRDDILEIFREQDAPIAPIYDIEDVMNDPHFQARNAIIEIPDEEYGTVKMQNLTPRLSETPGEIDHTGVQLGRDTEEVLLERTSATTEDVATMAGDGVVNLPG